MNSTFTSTDSVTWVNISPHTSKLGTGELTEEEEAELIAYLQGRSISTADGQVASDTANLESPHMQDPEFWVEIRRLEQQNRRRLLEDKKIHAVAHSTPQAGVDSDAKRREEARAAKKIDEAPRTGTEYQKHGKADATNEF
ncbi:hypothetical protein M409DRAFT_29993 [Zasmidium cellare ATCC 36951]|uniref:Uncharacterized protein n=1 Tax=Zasmidium cellare ATCC 36951 TaxID=1080233 RepID=A0A6A6C128_ZASCE|nr:uncharacterized protein M409DRAFT_29993 [Zasmidium cellare ATCC 36951]KAF2159519.1 hypothetical protein M409DRAFT_29993 [Zasmidium cellare ATCC 36951]